MRSLTVMGALVLIGVAAFLFFQPAQTGYWRATAAGTSSLYLGALAWALYAHDHRIALMAQQLVGQLDSAVLVRREIEEVVEELEALVGEIDPDDYLRDAN
jgi:hypothetical protein